jgi:clan AA aspartic protease
MGLIYADVELVNEIDFQDAKRHLIAEEEVRRIDVKALVDTGAMHLTIYETIKNYLGLEVEERQLGRLADGTVLELDLTGPVKIVFKNRTAMVRAMVLPDDEEVLLGAIAMEDLDVIIDPVRQEIQVNPDSPDLAMAILKGFRG